MKIADISVSRVHSYIRVMGNKLVLEDNGSKFGTHVKIFSPNAILSLQDQNGQDYKTRYKYNSKIFQVGRTMFYFKFFDLESKLIKKETKASKFPPGLKIDPNSDDLSYVALKGTTFKRKTMLENKLEYIPREFAQNEISVFPRQASREDEDGPESGSDNSDIESERQQKKLNNDSSTIFIQN